ncbi:DODA-type extradiol aromatic ring-opening family dioxygenase [Vibrio sp. HN007]|uniref:DODA-type extradiol aromatic ring-opening family dioxygenase n=1 Tax=Vibrio iocasae TaxID=3098914 RepID=UPI0035D4BECE
MRIEKQATLFISHGSPMLAIEDSETSRFLSQLGQQLGKPKAIVVFSAHLDVADDVIITAGKRPELIYDFYGFPKPLYSLKYPAPGHPELAEDIARIFANAGIESRLDAELGWDHGVWMPLYLMYPDADIPIVQVSINSRIGVESNYRLGKLLAPLRGEGVMLIGSGGISHNLREVFSPNPNKEKRQKVDAFTAWVDDKLQAKDTGSLIEYLKHAPHALFNHPTQEHFMPLFSAMGSSDLSEVVRLHDAVQYDVLAMDAYQFS